MFSLVFPKDIIPQTTERKQKTFTAVICIKQITSINNNQTRCKSAIMVRDNQKVQATIQVRNQLRLNYFIQKEEMKAATRNK